MHNCLHVPDTISCFHLHLPESGFVFSSLAFPNRTQTHSYEKNQEHEEKLMHGKLSPSFQAEKRDLSSAKLNLGQHNVAHQQINVCISIMKPAMVECSRCAEKHG